VQNQTVLVLTFLQSLSKPKLIRREISNRLKNSLKQLTLTRMGALESVIWKHSWAEQISNRT